MNRIPDLQNSEDHLKELAAQRQLYSEAKTTMGWQMGLVISAAIGLSFAALLFPKIQEWGALLALLISLLDAVVLEPRQKKLAQQAAKIQDAFDWAVFNLEGPGVKLENRPVKEMVIASAERYARKEPDFASLKNWYPISVGQAPLSLARIICQRTNIWWDAELRRRYATSVFICLGTLIVIVLGYGFATGMTLQKFVYAVLAPLQPAILWAIREYKKQLETASTLDRLMKQATDLFEQACRKSLTDDQLKQASRSLQNEIYDHRRTAPFIFDRIYKRLRKDDEDKMNKATDALLAECQNKEKENSYE